MKLGAKITIFSHLISSPQFPRLYQLPVLRFTGSLVIIIVFPSDHQSVCAFYKDLQTRIMKSLKSTHIMLVLKINYPFFSVTEAETAGRGRTKFLPPAIFLFLFHFFYYQGILCNYVTNMYYFIPYLVKRYNFVACSV